MKKKITQIGMIVISISLFTACSKDDNPAHPSTQIRPAVDYAILTAASNYFETFKDAAGAFYQWMK